MSESAARTGILGWLDQRYQLGTFTEFLRHKEVPVGAHSIVWYYLGGTTMFFFVVQILTGLLLLAYYQPGKRRRTRAFDSSQPKCPSDGSCDLSTCGARI